MTEPIDDSPAGRFMEGILAAMSQFDNEQRAARTRVGLRASAQVGRWVFRTSAALRKAFELCAKTRDADTRQAPATGRETFLYESSIDRITYEEMRDKLREELTLAELELSEAQVEQFD